LRCVGKDLPKHAARRVVPPEVAAFRLIVAHVQFDAKREEEVGQPHNESVARASVDGDAMMVPQGENSGAKLGDVNVLICLPNCERTVLRRAHRALGIQLGCVKIEKCLDQCFQLERGSPHPHVLILLLQRPSLCP